MIKTVNRKAILHSFALLCIGILSVNNHVLANSPIQPITANSNTTQSINLVDAQIKYIGRVTKGKQFSLTGSGLAFNLSGGNVWASFYIKEKNKAALNIVINGTEHALILKNGEHKYLIASNLPNGEHTISILKRNEAAKSTVQLTNLEIEPTHALHPAPTFKSQVLAIGDSITCGYGNEAKKNNEGNTLANQNGYQTYSAIAARKLQAEVMIVCWSGRGMSRNRSINNEDIGLLPQLYNYYLPNEPQEQWNPAEYSPEHILINLGTNDNANGKIKGELNKTLYLAAYQNFINTLRDDFPNAHLIFAIGPMKSGSISQWLPELTANNENTSSLIFTSYKGKSEIGGHYHPHVSKHKLMAEQLVEHIKVINTAN
ncbi:GDSL-type esterase/lipase family protein [Thalassotalea psychrophila]|uniref:GDSL-type esterase/lipase family protein n=1 Tax=Thalassotalea psychrophila TaxID=3065647 RepID=A0ABY9TW48_9GAMM|nr:GDSL-type esterase/lipase family protein [Colwelliaceae bacterium SQ149]